MEFMPHTIPEEEPLDCPWIDFTLLFAHLDGFWTDKLYNPLLLDWIPWRGYAAMSSPGFKQLALLLPYGGALDALIFPCRMDVPIALLDRPSSEVISQRPLRPEWLCVGMLWWMCRRMNRWGRGVWS